jgi:succinyl-diaminopimelate desuccinylase
MKSVELLTQLLGISSPTYKEQAVVGFIKQWMQAHTPEHNVFLHNDSVVFNFPQQAGKKHIAFVGHSDTVPAFFDPYEDNGRLFGSGASDMKGGVAAFMYFIAANHQALLEAYNVSLIVYAREEGTPLNENGLNDLIKVFPDYIQSIDLAIVGEPTNLTVQLGCVGSIHARIRTTGIAAHSARPWDGENAIYKAAPIITALANIQPLAHEIGGVTFYDTFQLTQASAASGKTTVPDWWEGNVNFRFAPRFNNDEAVAYCIKMLKSCGLKENQIEILDISPGGHVIDSDLYQTVIQKLEVPIEAKQAWTDVAQLTLLGVPAFNFGPGLTSQAHKVDEYINIDDFHAYLTHLSALLESE